MSNQNASRTFEVHGTLNLGYRPGADKKAPRELDIRTRPATVTEEELLAVGMTADDIDGLLSNGTIGDPDAPTRPSVAPIYAAHALAARLARHFGLLKVKGAEHNFNGQTFTGIQAFRDGVSLDTLETALRNAWHEKGAE